MCMIPVFKCLCIEDIEDILKNMKRNKKRKEWCCCVVLESEEQNRNIDIFARCLRDKNKDLLRADKLKEEQEEANNRKEQLREQISLQSIKIYHCNQCLMYHCNPLFI